jgi:hypothetical protein
MTMEIRMLKSVALVALITAAGAVVGCGDDDAKPDGSAGSGGSGASAGTHASGAETASGGEDSTPEGGAPTSLAGAAGAGPDAPPPLYAIESLVFGMNEGDSSTSYVSLLDTLDRTDEVKLDTAREFPGYAPLDTVDGKLYAGSGEAPTITSFEVSPDLRWKTLKTISFSNFTSASFDGNVIVDSTRAVVALGDKNWVSYDPAALEIGDLVELSADIPNMRGAYLVQRGYGHEISGTTVYQPYYWSDATFQLFTQESQIAVFDAATSEFTNVLDAPCPHLHITTADEDGNMYFSNGAASIASAVLDDSQPRNCMVRLKKGATAIDETFTVDFKDLADGREGSNLFYVKDGVAFFNVYHAERDDLKADTMYGTVMYSPSYHLWTLDLKTMKAKIMDGIGYTGGQYVAFHLGDRVFIAVPNAAYTSTEIYEVTADGAEKKFDVEGWAFKMLKVR